jgi:type IV secretory pathway VirB10-like protein
MKINRTTLLTGVAALALITGTGFASAQQQQKGHNPPPPHAAAPPHPAPQPHAAAPPHPSQPMAARPHVAQPQHANRTVPNRGQAAQRNGTHNPRVGQSASPTQPARHAQERRNRANEGPTAQERRIPRGLQGNASGQVHGQPQLSEEQRTRIRQSVINARGAPRVGHVDFDVRVGTRIPRSHIHLIGVPEYLVQIDPDWQGFLYFVYGDDIVIVDPSDMEIVAVLPV